MRDQFADAWRRYLDEEYIGDFFISASSDSRASRLQAKTAKTPETEGPGIAGGTYEAPGDILSAPAAPASKGTGKGSVRPQKAVSTPAAPAPNPDDDTEELW
jgi:hypothetical protein